MEKEVLDDPAVTTLESIVDHIFPADDDCAGGAALGVVSFVLGQLARPWGQGERMYRHPPFVTPPHPGHGWQSEMTPAEAFRYGLAALDEHAIQVHGAPFPRLPPAVQRELLAGLEQGTTGTFQRLDPALFFDLLLSTCVEGVFSDPQYGGNRDGAAWAWIGFPGPGTYAENASAVPDSPRRAPPRTGPAPAAGIHP